MNIKMRFAQVLALAEQYADFKDFAYDGMKFLGFSLTRIQEDIAEFMQSGPRLRMVMAQRGEAKTTLAALYAVWRIIHKPSTRVLIVSAGEDNSSQTSTLIVRLIMQWEILECIRPDRQAGDKTGTDAFDVHYSLKGLDRSPSVSCVGINSNLPGRRADLLIPDDVESNKNGLSATQRAKLLHDTKEFSSICTHGDILYLGTPQSKDSIYNTLQGRGFMIRIWPGRYPAVYQDQKGEVIDEAEKYGTRLAPLIARDMLENPNLKTGGGIDGTRGQPSDPERYTDEDLIEKYLDKGPEDFQLQYMLDTSLVDAMRQQLRLSDLINANFSPDLLPERVMWQASSSLLVPDVEQADFPALGAKMYYAAPLEGITTFSPKDVFMFMDPAGGGGDEIGYGIGCAIGAYIHVLDCGGLLGGLTPANEKEIMRLVKDYKVTRIKCEKNMGHGLFCNAIRSIFMNSEDMKHAAAYVGEGEYSSNQKEKRIIDSLVSPMQRHKVVIHRAVWESDRRCNLQYGEAERSSRSVWFQMANITTDRDSLPHDDRLEALAGVVREFKHVIVQDEAKAEEKRKASEAAQFIADPMGYGTSTTKYDTGSRGRVGAKRRRR